MDVWQVLLAGFILAVWSLVCAMVGAAIAINSRKAERQQVEPYRERKTKLIDGEGN